MEQTRYFLSLRLKANYSMSRERTEQRVHINTMQICIVCVILIGMLDRARQLPLRPSKKKSLLCPCVSCEPVGHRKRVPSLRDGKRQLRDIRSVPSRDVRGMWVKRWEKDTALQALPFYTR